MRPRVLHLGKYYPPHSGGMESHLRTLCRGLSGAADLEVLVASEGLRTVSDAPEGVAVTRLSTPLTVASAPLSPGLLRRLRTSDADIVHLHWPHPAAALAYLASGRSGPLVVTYHSDTVRQRVLGPLFAPFLKALLEKASAIIVSSRRYLETSPILPAYASKCRIIPFGIGVEPERPMDDGASVRLRGQYGTPLIVSVGRLVYYKGFEHIIRAMPKIDARLLLVGEGPLGASLRRLAWTLGLEDKVFFLGRQEDVRPFLRAADVFVLPSVARTEAFGIVQLEAMAAGVPVVNTSIPSGVPTVSVHGETGLTVRPGDPDALAAAIGLLLDDPQLRRTYGEAGRRRVESVYRVESMCERTLALYGELLGVRP